MRRQNQAYCTYSSQQTAVLFTIELVLQILPLSTPHEKGKKKQVAISFETCFHSLPNPLKFRKKRRSLQITGQGKKVSGVIFGGVKDMTGWKIMKRIPELGNTSCRLFVYQIGHASWL